MSFLDTVAGLLVSAENDPTEQNQLVLRTALEQLNENDIANLLGRYHNLKIENDQLQDEISKLQAIIDSPQHRLRTVG